MLAGKHLQPLMVCNARDLVRIFLATLSRPHREAFKVLILLERYFFIWSCDEKPPLAVPAVKLDFKSDMDCSHTNEQDKAFNSYGQWEGIQYPGPTAKKELQGCRFKAVG